MMDILNLAICATHQVIHASQNWSALFARATLLVKPDETCYLWALLFWIRKFRPFCSDDRKHHRACKLAKAASQFCCCDLIWYVWKENQGPRAGTWGPIELRQRCIIIIWFDPTAKPPTASTIYLSTNHIHDRIVRPLFPYLAIKQINFYACLHKRRQFVRNMNSLRSWLQFWWLCDNMINCHTQFQKEN